MKTLLIIACIILNLNSQAQGNVSIKPGPQGGGIKAVQAYQVELVNSISRVSVYLYDKSLNPVSNEGVLSEIIFCYAYNECLNKQLTPLGKNGYTVSLSNSHFNYCEVNLIINGKPLNVKFNNSIGLAESK